MKEAILGGAHLEEAVLHYVHLDGADLSEDHVEGEILGLSHLEGGVPGAYLEHADLSHAYLKGALLLSANLKRAILHDVHLEGAGLSNANLEGAKLVKASLEGTRFRAAFVDGSTLIWDCSIDRHTDFRSVGLENLRIEPAIKQLLEQNIRRMNWEEWYPKHPLLRWPVRLFWCFSDYGLSTWRIITVFFGLSLFFAAIYANCACWCPPGIVSNLEVEPHLPLWHYLLLLVLRPVYFSVVTMTTGFSNMYANAQSIWGHLLIGIQVLLGYTVLGALITRFAVLFTAGGPAGKFADETGKKDKT